MKTRTSLSLISAGALVVSGCASTQPATESAEPGVRTVVATTTVLGSVVSDITQCIGADVVQTAVLMPIGADPHDFAPSSEQVALMSESGLVVANGLGLEQGLSDVLDQFEADGGVVYHVAEWIDPLLFAADEHDHTDQELAEDEDDHTDEEHADEHDHGAYDPHFWFDMARMADVARALGAGWEAEFGPDAVTCGEQVAANIEQADSRVKEILAAIPAQKRVLVTDHQAFSYFAERYDFDVAGVVIPGGSTLAEPSSQELADLIQTVLAEGVSAVVSNYFEPSAVLDSVAEEGGEITVVPLYVGSIGDPDGDAGDYQSMMLTNARLLAEALS
jgi:zinc/manganese transport system substrate-binding protein